MASKLLWRGAAVAAARKGAPATHRGVTCLVDLVYGAWKLRSSVGGGGWKRSGVGGGGRNRGGHMA